MKARTVAILAVMMTAVLLTPVALKSVAATCSGGTTVTPSDTKFGT